MRWLLSYICPPLCVLSCGKPFSAILNVFLTLCLWKPGVRHAHFVLGQYLDDQRMRQMVDATNNPEWTRNQLKAHGILDVKPRTKPPIEVVDHPAIGMNGTQFRKRTELN